jgi:hypothetical protein
LRIRFTSALLLLVLIAPVLIAYCWLQYQISNVKNEVRFKMTKGIDKDELVVMKFTKAESQTIIRWAHPGEMEYNNQMYDIVDTKITVDTVYYWCWRDVDETRLRREFIELSAKAFNSDPQKKEKQERIYSYFNSLYLSENPECCLTPPCPENRKFSSYSMLFPSFSFPPPTPPPKEG